MRIGIGYDVHPFAPDRPLVLGGVTVPHSSGLQGNSDGDVLTHALIDALLGAAALGDIGTHFSSEDEQWRGANSIDLLAKTHALLLEAGFQKVHVYWEGTDEETDEGNDEWEITERGEACPGWIAYIVAEK